MLRVKAAWRGGYEMRPGWWAYYRGQAKWMQAEYGITILETGR